MAHQGNPRRVWLTAMCLAVACASFTITATTAGAAQTNPAEDVYAFGDAPFHGSTGNLQLARPIVGIARTASGNGYYEVATDGGIFSFGDARFFGSTGAIQLNKPIVGMAVTPTGKGYWLVATDGGIFAFGDAAFYGSTGSIHLNRPIVGMAPTPSGHGYWLVATDGGIFSFGDAAFHGSTGSIALNQPVVGMASTPLGHGYWLVASDGGIFSFGDAAFYGSTGSLKLVQPITGMTSTPLGRGYWLAARDGGIFSFGDAGFYGSMGGVNLGTKSVIGMAASRTGHGYWLAATRPTPPPSPPPPPPAPVAFGDGVYRVGVNIPAGTYRTRSAASGCYWERLSGFSGTTDQIIANDFTDVTAIVSIDSTDAGFHTSGCGTWTSDLSRITGSTTAPFGGGTYIVGTDIAPGTWQSSGGTGCYWERLSGFSGTTDQIIANDFTDSPAIVTISVTDKGFHAGSECGTWTKIG